MGKLAIRFVKKRVLSLRDKEFEAIYQDVKCQKCRENEAQELVYRVFGENDWKKVSEIDELWCKECRDKSLIETTDDVEAYRNRAIAERYWFIPDDLIEAGFRNYDPCDEQTEKARSLCMKYVQHFSNNSKEDRANLVLMGSCGSGKSHLSVAIARTIKDKGFTVGFITTGELLTKIKSTYNKHSSVSEGQILDDIKKLDLLIIDDLAAETHNLKDDFSWSKTKIFDIVNARIGKPTIYSSNLNDKALEKAVGERVFSRLNKNTKFIELFTEDYRKRLRVEQLKL